MPKIMGWFNGEPNAQLKIDQFDLSVDRTPNKIWIFLPNSVINKMYKWKKFFLLQIQHNLHLVREVLDGLKDDTKAALINLDKSKVDHRFLATVLETAGFKPGFRKWISMLYHNLQAVVQVNRERLKAFVLEWSVRQGCSLSPLLYVLALEPLLHRLRDRSANLTLRGVFLAGCVRAKDSAYVDDIPVFVSHRSDIKVVKKALKRYEEVAGVKINFDKSKGLQLGAWRGGVSLPGPFRWSDGPVCILRKWFEPGLQLERKWLEVRAKVEAQMGNWLRRRLSVKGRAEVCAVYIFPLILFWLSVLPLSKVHRRALIQSLSKLLWSDQKPIVR